MNWSNLADFKCPGCGGRLTLMKVRKLFLCFACKKAIRQEKRKEIAAQYPVHIPASTLIHMREIIPTIR